MIAVKRINGQEFILNCDLIESIESDPNTRIKLATGKTVMVQEPVAEVVKRVIRYKQLCNSSVKVLNESEGDRR